MTPRITSLLLGKNLLFSKKSNHNRKCCLCMVSVEACIIMSLHTQLSLLIAQKIIPILVSEWNRSTAAFGWSEPQILRYAQTAICYERIQKIAITVGFVLKHWFPKIEAPRGEDVTVIQVHHGCSMALMKDIMYSCSASLELIHPISGIIHGYPVRKKAMPML